jgi:hypothetical protein
VRAILIARGSSLCGSLFLIPAIISLFAIPERATAQPSGSYRQTCAVESFGGDSITARCKDRAGNFRPTMINLVSQCVGDISNDDGALRCNRGGMPPPGSYLQSCERTFVAGSALTSVCRSRDGQRMVHTTLTDFRNCTGDIHNDNGFLSCSRGGIPPPGSYTQSCEQTSVSGETLFSLCRNRNGGLVRAQLNNFRQCTRDINNNDGVLNCSR